MRKTIRYSYIDVDPSRVVEEEFGFEGWNLIHEPTDFVYASLST